ncbi:MAG TPA: S-layer homology domain-containing protein [Candidatus Evtepia faecavium]|nr:S-layer homology domain-containing protein [Candidatus Evtepia faecavium]
MGKRMLSLCMALALCLGLLPATALAADTEMDDWEEIVLPQEPELTDTWLGSDEDGEPYYDISWYDANETEFELDSAADLAGLAALLLQSYNWQDVDAEMERPDDFPDGNDLENLKKANITLSGDIDLSAHSWVPIETFSGTFDGNERTISGLRVTSGVTSYAGLFSYGSPTVKDVTLDNVYIVSDESSAGGIIGDARSEANIENCKVSGSILYKGESNAACSVGGIAGEIGSEVSVSDCTFSGTVYSQNYLWHTNGIGGIVGSTSGSTIENCTTVKGAKVCTGATNINAGGIVGYVTNGSVTDCTNHGTINTKSESDTHGVGGIVGKMYLKKASNDYGIQTCTNTGEITAAGGATGGNIGGILGQTSGASIEISQCSNTGKISSTQSGNSLKLGGLVGSTGGALTLTQSYNVGSVDIPSSTGYAGGLIGEATRPTSLQVENCYNVGAVTGGTVGGLIGRLYATDSSGRTVSISSSYNTGTVNNGKGNAMVGQTSTYVTLTVADNCTYLDTSGTGGLGKSQTANQMTDDTAWATNLGLNSSTWKKENNPTTVDSDGNWMGNLPVLTANKQDPAPQIQRTQKQDQPGFAITNEPTPTDTIYIDSTGFQLGTTGGAEGLSVTWSSSEDKVATVDSNGKVTIKGVGEVTITAQKAGNDSYNEASDAYTFTVYGRPIEKVFISNLVAPVEGANPVQYIDVPEDDPYKGMITAGVGGPSKLSVIWEDEAGNDVNVGETFQKDTVYIAVFRVKCDTYYSFSDQVRVVLENMNESAYSSITAKKDTQNPDNLIITVTFNATDHVHSWDTGNWTANPTHHWHACRAKDCPLKDPQGMCSYTQHTDTDNNGTCDICEGIIGYLITFNANGGVCEIQNTRTDVNGALSSLPTPTRSGYTFLGWYTENGTQVGEDTVFTQNTTLTAQWQYNAPPANPNYKITIEDTENGAVTAPTSAKQGTEVTLTPIPDEGFDVGTVTVTDRFGDAVEVTANPDGTYTFTMPNGQVTVEVTFVESQPEPLPFTDVAESDWFYDAVRYAYENGLMGGVGDNLFAPNHPTTRAQLVTILYRLEGEPEVSGQSGFTDVEADTWYTDAVAWAAEEGVVNGVSETQFAPGNNITREQLATILFRYAQAKGCDVSPRADLSGFPDAGDILPYAQEAMAWAVAEGLLQGFEDDTLRPQGNATRAQIATILMRFCEGVVE